MCKEEASIQYGRGSDKIRENTSESSEATACNSPSTSAGYVVRSLLEFHILLLLFYLQEERRQAEKEAKRPEKRSWDLRAAMMKCINTCMPVKKFKSQYLPGYAVGRSRLRRLIDSM